MKALLSPILAISLLIACNTDTKETDSKEEPSESPVIEEVFDSKKWKVKKEDKYPHRPQMYRKILYSDSVRTLLKPQVISMLGEPDREENNHLYYIITQNQIGSWKLNQKSMVFKFRENDSVEWIKMHE